MCVIGLTLVLLNLPRQVNSHLKLAARAVFLPILGLAGTSHALAEWTADRLPARMSVGERNRLQNALETARTQALELDLLRDENRRLREASEWEEHQPWNLRLARVIGRDPSNWWRTLALNAGTRRGVLPNQPVLRPEGLVGRIIEASPGRSQVVLVGDPGCRVACRVQETGDLGILLPAPAGALDLRLARLTYLADGREIAPGQHLVTSGQGGLFPAGIPVGTILDKRIGERGLTEARVRLAIDPARIETVWVMSP